MFNIYSSELATFLTERSSITVPPPQNFVTRIGENKVLFSPAIRNVANLPARSAGKSTAAAAAIS